MFDAIIILTISVIIVSIPILFIILSSPFKYPYFEYKFDVSGKRKPQIDDYIDNFLIKGGYEEIIKHLDIIVNWKKECEERIENSVLKELRTEQYQKSLDDANAFCFLLIRKQTRYRQINYVRHPYTIQTVYESHKYDFDYITDRYNKLKEINFECTLNTYHTKDQRKLMTKELRKKIMKRDNYTCQLCGKYMPDEVGLHIDHIVPIKKGGKSVESNLQVLCSKCNGSKSSK